MISHHPGEELFVDYVAGALPEAFALAIATHASLCADCAHRIQTIEAIGGDLLANVLPVPCSDDALANVLARLDEPDAASRAVERRPFQSGSHNLPSPLNRYVDRPLHRLPWRTIGRGLFEEFQLPLTGQDSKAALCRLPPGMLVPHHVHWGAEYVLVLDGGYQDGDKQFRRGDFAALDLGDTHQPNVDPDKACLCLVVQDAPMWQSMLVDPFLRL